MRRTRKGRKTMRRRTSSEEERTTRTMRREGMMQMQIEKIAMTGKGTEVEAVNEKMLTMTTRRTTLPAMTEGMK